jgi:hypothetical protein
MSNENEPQDTDPTPPADQQRADGADLVFAALDQLRRISGPDVSSSGPSSLIGQKKSLVEWAGNLGLLLDPEQYFPQLQRGGQEHDVHETDGCVFKVTRHGVFGLSPGIELALVSSSEEVRRFHLWEASPLEYLERLHLQNQLVPRLNSLVGVIYQSNDDLAIVTSQPRFEIVPATTPEIAEWFASMGFVKIADAAFYRTEDNLGIFDAHDKNVIRAGEVLIPFDVIPIRPAGGFLDFIEETISQGHTLRAVRTIS